MKIIRLLSVTTLFLAAFSLSGCIHGKKGAGGGGGSASDSDYVNGTPLPERQEGVSFTSSNTDRNKFSPIYFAFDSFSIGSGERSKIDEVANFMKSAPNTLILAGFTDERGTPEYNRGLGERRAQAVRDALIHAGADGSRIQTVSFGAEMPADPGSGESAWTKNRRAEFGVVR
ncbi:MAG TPA: OmpA family protein [Chthoniobacter sp.]|jgi:peptidoglycan-associated lipoprotein